MSQISELIKFAKSDPINSYKEINFGNVPNFQAQNINAVIGIKVNGAKILSSYGITHIIKEHGDEKEQSERGQKGITDNDFELIPQILREPDEVTKGAKNSRGKQTLVFKKKIGSFTYFLVMSVSLKNDKVDLFVNTMYAKK